VRRRPTRGRRPWRPASRGPSAPAGARRAAHRRGAGRQRHGLAAQVGQHQQGAVVEGHHLRPQVAPPQGAGAEPVLAPQAQRGPVRLVRRAGHPPLAVQGVPRPVRRLRQPARRARPEAVRRRVGRPRDRHPAAVPAPLGPTRAAEARILADLVGQRGVLRQAQLLALVEVCRTGQGQHQQRGGAGPAQPERRVGLRVGGPDAADPLRPDRQAEPRGVPDHVMVGQHPGRRGAHGRTGAQRPVDHLALRGGGPGRLQVVEVERLVHLVGPHVRREPLGRAHPRLGHQHPPAGVAVHQPPPGAVDLVHPVLVPDRRRAVAQRPRGRREHRPDPGEVGRLDQAVRHVHPEAVHPPIQPEPQDLLELGPHQRVVPVEVRLGGVEQVQVPLAGGAVRLGHPGPGRTAEHALPVVGRHLAARSAAVAEQVTRPLRTARPGRHRGAEPLVGARRVVGHQVEDHPQAARVGLVHQLVGVGQAAEQRVDRAVVGDVVAGVGLRGGVERRHPDRVHAQLHEVVQPARHAGEVAEAVTVGVGEGARVDLVDDRVPPPPRVVRLPLSGAVAHPHPSVGHRRPDAGGARRCGQWSRIAANRSSARSS